jgi:short-subunit dehydrogenase
MSFVGKRYWLVGASEGLGRALAHKMSAAGAELVISARSESRLKELADELSNKVQVMPLDLADGASVARVGADLGRVDGIVFLASVYWPMHASQWNGANAIAMAEINFTGLFRVLDQVMGQFVERDAGHIVITGSLSGVRGFPGAIGYVASKAGIMSLAESLYADLRTSGIRVQLSSPGFIETRQTDKNKFRMPFIMSPDEAAEHMMRHLASNRFKSSFPRPYSWFVSSSQFWPHWLFSRIFG